MTKPIEERINETINEFLQSDYIEKQVENALKEATKKACDDLTGWGSPISKIINENIKDVMIPIIEKYDYSQHITKLDVVLAKVLQESLKPNNEILEKFNKAIEPAPESVDIKDILNEYIKYKESNYDYNLIEDEIEDYYDGDIFEIPCSIEVVRSGYLDNKYSLVLKNDYEDDIIEINLRKGIYDNDFLITTDLAYDLQGLNYLSDFEIYLLNLQRNFTKITWDKAVINDEINLEIQKEY